jgi:hypothetical protein
MILILTSGRDVQADHVEQKLRERGADFVRFDHGDFPSRAEVSLRFTAAGQTCHSIRRGEEIIDLDDLTAVWCRRPTPPVPHPEVRDKLSRDFVAMECRMFLQDAWDCLDCLWLPATPAVQDRAQLKAAQLKAAAALGFELPPTLVTNSPADFLEFYREHQGNVVSKLAAHAFFRVAWETFSRYTEVVSRSDVGYAQAVRYAPVLFQAYVPKRVEIRITVVGREVFAAEIHSQASNHTRHDWRRYDHYTTPYLPHELPPNLERRCVQLVERLGLCYGAIDMVLTPDGRYVFLEVNPCGEFGWIEAATGLPISDAICDLLVSGARPNRAVQNGSACPTGGLG